MYSVQKVPKHLIPNLFSHSSMECKRDRVIPATATSKALGPQLYFNAQKVTDSN